MECTARAEKRASCCLGLAKQLCGLGLPGFLLKKTEPICTSDGAFIPSIVGFRLPMFVLCREMNKSFFSVLCTLNYSNLVNEVSAEADVSLWCFFVERRDSSGSVSPTTTNQEESEEICLYHIRKSCSFQGKSEETPSTTCGWDNCFSFLELCSEATPKSSPLSRESGP